MTDTPAVSKKRARELKTMRKMIAIYCRGKHSAGEELCPQCTELQEYASQRIAHCPHMESKTFCSVCPTHCYSPERREEIRCIMRYSGPRMLLYAPRLALWHILLQWSSRRKK